MLPTFISRRWFHPLLLVVWIAIGAGLRFTQLAGKSPWTDEFATLVFSLGNTYQTVPLDQAISLETLLQPLQPNNSAGASVVIHHLVTEDHHPPLYFVLAHWWMQLFPTSDEYISLWVARSLPALFGVISIPAVYGLGFLAFHSRLVAQLAAAMMAVSPYGIFLTQEARHYALGILWVIASLCCLVVAVQHLKRHRPLPIGVALCWVVVNSLGMATHYFFSLTLCAEAIALIGFGILGGRFIPGLRKFLPVASDPHRSFSEEEPQTPQSPVSTSRSYWGRIFAVAAGTLVGCLVWIPVWQASHDSQMTQWIMTGASPTGRNWVLHTLLTLINPIFQSLAAWITMVSLLPVEASALPVVIASGAVMIGFFLWALPIFYRGLKAQLEQPETRLATGVLGGFVLGAIAIFFSITYFLRTDLTRGARYNFVYFPAVIVLLGAAIAISWNSSERDRKSNPYLHPPQPLHEQASAVHSKYKADIKVPPSQTTKFSSLFRISGKPAVALIWLMGLLSGITVVSNLGYQKYYRPDLLVPVIQQASSVPVLIATTHNTLVQTGELMGLAWEFKGAVNLKESPVKPQFLLAHQAQEECTGAACPASTTLQKTLAQLPRPLDLWLVNFKASTTPESLNCLAKDTSQYQTSVNGYAAKLYHCLATDPNTVSRQVLGGTQRHRKTQP